MSGTMDQEFHTVRGYQLLNQQGGRLTPAMEDYLEMIYRECIRNSYARVGRLSELLHVRPSSASKMLLRLSALGLIKYDRYEIILLTDKGRELGAFLLGRHETVERFLVLLGVGDPLEETELIEHSLSSATVARLGTLIEFFAHNPACQKSFAEFRSGSR